MMSLDRGGECPGVALRMDPGEDAHAALVSLLRQEPPVPPERVTAGPDAGPGRRSSSPRTPGFPLYQPEPEVEALADLLASAAGHVGTMAGYLLNTVGVRGRGLVRHLLRCRPRHLIGLKPDTAAPRLEQVSASLP